MTEAQKHKMNGQKRHYIYYIQQEKTGHIKIGLACNVAARLKQLQTGSPYKLKLLYVESRQHRKNAVLLEKKRLTSYKKFNMMGEWHHESCLPYLKKNVFRENKLKKQQIEIDSDLKNYDNRN